MANKFYFESGCVCSELSLEYTQKIKKVGGEL